LNIPAMPTLTAPASAAVSRYLAIPESLAQLTALFQFQRELLRLEAAWLAGVPYWDAKLKLGEHLWPDAQHAEAVLKRLHELKASAAEHKQVPGLDELMRELAAAARGDAWLHALHTVVKPWLAAQLRAHCAATDPLMDRPTHETLGRIARELDAQGAWFAGFTPQFSTWEQPATETRAWCDRTRALLRAIAITGGRIEGLAAALAAHPRPPGHDDFDGIERVRRDRTFRCVDKAEVAREGATFEEKRFIVFYNHSQEMQFAESLGAILHETSEMPWAFHFDLARHTADEVRHAQMGQARLEQLGHRLQDVPMMTQHYGFRRNLDPLERFCLMTLVMEATAFERKRAHVELFEAHGDADSARYESYDIRDEMQHTNLGHVWVPILLRVYHDSRSVAELTEHCRKTIAQVITEYPANAANMIKR
jgi:hypothetical protein